MDSEKTTGTEYKDSSIFSQNGGMRGFSIYNTEGDVYYRSEVERVAYELRKELYPAPEAPQPLPVQQQKKKAKREKATTSLRVFPLVIILILNLLVLAVIALSCFDIGKIGVMCAPFVKVAGTKETVIPFIDGLFAELSSFGMKSTLDYALNADATSNIVLMVFAGAAAAFALLTLVEVIIAIAGLACKKKDGKGVRFGLVALLMMISLAGVLLSFIALKAEVGFGDFCSLVLPRSIGSTQYGLPRTEEGYIIYSGYGLYLMLIVPILNMIFSALAHKKKK